MKHESNKTGNHVAFVAGATGYVGSHVARVLAERNIETHAHVRPDSGRLDEWRKRFEAMGIVVDTTPWDEASMTETLRSLKPTLIFALLGTTRARMKKMALAGGNAADVDYMAVDYGLTMLLLRAAKNAGLKPRFVYLSAAGAQKPSLSPYYKARYRAEREIEASGVAYTFARPSFITGPDREEKRTGERVGAAVADGLLGIAGFLGARKLERRYSSTDGETLARALVTLSLDPAAANRAFESEELRARSGQEDRS